MKKLAALLLSALFLLPLTACRTKETASRAETVQERYAALTSYTAAAAVELAGEEENVRYTLRFDADAEETKVTVLAPELLAGVTAHLTADTLKLEYDGLVLEAGGETLQCTHWFGADDAPLRAEIAEKDKITAYMEFTSFAFCDTIAADESEAGG